MNPNKLETQKDLFFPVSLDYAFSTLVHLMKSPKYVCVKITDFSSLFAYIINVIVWKRSLIFSHKTKFDENHRRFVDSVF